VGAPRSTPSELPEVPRRITAVTTVAPVVCQHQRGVCSGKYDRWTAGATHRRSAYGYTHEGEIGNAE
jgi:hypothetical protein